LICLDLNLLFLEINQEKFHFFLNQKYRKVWIEGFGRKKEKNKKDYSLLTNYTMWEAEKD